MQRNNPMEWKVSKIWEGDCWIIGGGYSLSEQFNIPVDLVPQTKEEFLEYGKYLESIHLKRCIGTNIAAFLGDWIDVAYFGDSDTYIEYRAWWDDFPGLKISSAGKFAAEDIFDVKFLNKDATRGITRRRNTVAWNAKNTGASAIDLAIKFGAKRIYLLGFDMYLAPTGRIHWHAGYPDKLKTPTKKQRKEGKAHPRKKVDSSVQENVFNKHLKGWELIAEGCVNKEIEVINVNPKSRIDVFPKADLSEILET